MPNKISIDKIMSNFDDAQIESVFEDLIDFKWSNYSENETYKLRKVFKANLKNKSLFPDISKGKSFFEKNEQERLQEYLLQWGYKFLDAPIPSRHKGTGPKSPYDGMIYRLLSMCPRIELDNDQAREAHERAMQSENLIGQLLEEFIARQISPYGWIWCKGSVMVATDFYFQKDDGTGLFLQVKNKFNTENSSSSRVRVGTPIQKWNRLIKKKLAQSNEAQSNWLPLRAIVYDQAGVVPNNPNELSEEEFEKFLDNVSKSNPFLIF